MIIGMSSLLVLLGSYGLIASPVGLEAVHDNAALLYSNQLAFSADGDPVITVGLMKGQEQIELTSSTGLRVQLSGPANATVTLPAHHTVRARVSRGVPGENRYRVVLEGIRGADLKRLRTLRQRWEDRGLQVEVRELGGMVGFPKRVIDNRHSLLVERMVYTDAEKAQGRAQAIAERWQLEAPPRIKAEPVRRAQGHILLEDLNSGMVIGQDDMIELQAIGDGIIEIKAVEYGRSYAHHGRADRSYHGSIVVAVDANARLAAVNRVSAELLLRGLVPAEIFPSAPAAALQAQAITARGELLAKLGTRHLADPFLVCASQHCQVYSGAGAERPRTNNAVKATRGDILFDDTGKIVDSVYSASCGGHTEHNEHVWGGVARTTLRGRPDQDGSSQSWKTGEIPTEEELRAFVTDSPDTYCGASPLGRKVFRWQRRYTATELNRLVNQAHAVGAIQRIEVLSRGTSGRVIEVRYHGTDASVTLRGELKNRRLLDNLRSGMFVVDRDPSDKSWLFTGGGWGHGVGMCQYGAIGRATQGQDAREILRHYYGGAHVERVY